MNAERSTGSFHRVFIGVGSNTGDRKAHIDAAVGHLKEIPDTKVVARSELKEYAAEGVKTPQGDFLNGIVVLETELLPLDLLEKLQIIERKMGRSTKGDRQPRPIDLDILSFDGDVVIQGKTLSVPHPRMHERRFVLEPFVEIAPDWVHPKFKKTARELLAALADPNEDRHVHAST